MLFIDNDSLKLNTQLTECSLFRINFHKFSRNRWIRLDRCCAEASPIVKD